MQRPRTELLAFALRSHRWAIASWAVGLAAVSWIFGLGYAREMSAYPGGPEAFARGIEIAAGAMRMFRWPAERLDTFAGYLTYHNVTLLPLLLGLYALVQGTQAIRGAEERGVLEVWLVTGRRRGRIVGDRAIAFLLAMVLVAGGLGAGTLLGLEAAGERAPLAAFVVAALVALCAAGFYGLGLVLSQLVASARTAAGLGAIVMLVLFVVNNVWELLDPLGALRFPSPFYYRQRSELLLPGHAFDPAATLALVLVFVVPVAASIAAFERRDLGAGLWWRPANATARPVSLSSPWLRSLWTAALGEQRVALAAWAVGSGTYLAWAALLGKPAIDVWESSSFIRTLLVRHPGATFIDEYLAFALALLAVVSAAFAVTQAGRWAGESAEGRVEMILACPVSRARLVLERIASLAVGNLVIVVGGLAGFCVGAALAELPVRADGLLRTVWDAELLALAVGGVGAVLVLALRGAVTAVLSAAIAVSYLWTLVAVLFGWPEWALRLSIFDAFGDPYVGTPPVAGTLYLAAIAVGGTVLAAVLAERRRSEPV